MKGGQNPKTMLDARSRKPKLVENDATQKQFFLNCAVSKN
jgi:hypothetical protein